MSSPKILVLGSTGSIGSEVAKALNARGVDFKAAVHSLEKSEKLKELPHAKPVVVDLYNPQTLATALEGVEKLFFLTPPGQTHVAQTIIDEIKKAGGVKHIVKLSALGCEEKDPQQFQLAHEHSQFEDLIKSNGFALTSLRPSSFFTNLLQEAHSIKETNSLGNYHNNTKMSWIAPADIGEVAAIALTQAGHEGKDYYLTGRRLTMQEVADILSEVLGRKISAVPLDEKGLREKVSAFLPPAFVDPYVNMMDYFANGGYDKFFDDFEKVTGKKLAELKPWIQQNKAIWL